ncbi:MAG: AAA family ATPase, partial [Acutalibacteraceae bacterium]
HLDLNSGKYMAPGDLDVVLDQQLNNWEARYGVTRKYDDCAARMNDIIDAAYEKTGRQVVILIDEYDKPIVNNLGNEELTDYYRKTLQGFYSVLKAKDGKIRFGFLTGVSKIGKLSVFSTLNNLRDISMETEYSDICGISEEDLHKYFDGRFHSTPKGQCSALCRTQRTFGFVSAKQCQSV